MVEYKVEYKNINNKKIETHDIEAINILELISKSDEIAYRLLHLYSVVKWEAYILINGKYELMTIGSQCR